MAFFIKVNGDKTHVTDLSKKNLEKLINGEGQLIPVEKNQMLFINRDAMVFHLPVNSKATSIFNQKGMTILGDVILLEKGENLNFK